MNSFAFEPFSVASARGILEELFIGSINSPPIHLIEHKLSLYQAEKGRYCNLQYRQCQISVLLFELF